jgi:hypothetical protein
MSSGENPMLRPLASQPLAPNDLSTGVGLRGRAGANRAECSVTYSHYGCRISNQERLSNISDIVCEIYKEDLANRAQARKFLWEFFD